MSLWSFISTVMIFDYVFPVCSVLVLHCN